MEILLKIVEIVFTMIILPALFVVARLIAKVQTLEERLSKGDLPEHWRASIKSIVEEVLNRSDKNVTDRMEKLEKQILDVSMKQLDHANHLHRVMSHLKIYTTDK